MRKLILLIVLASMVSCKSEPAKKIKERVEGVSFNIKYAKGFTIKQYATYKIIEIHKPWPEAKRIYRYALLEDNYKADYWIYERQRFNNTLEIPIQKIVVTSTTHLPALELLGVEQTLVGFPGTDYISSEKIREQLDKGNIRELGKNESLNTEVLLELKPDIVVGFGIDGGNRSLETLKNAGIPVIFNGDWVENSPLAKAEWIKFFGALYNKEKVADSIFNHIETNYLEAKQLAINATLKPTVLSGAMHSDIWYLPNGTSTEGQLLKDANVNYLWSDTKGAGSLKLNFESVFVKAKNADIWLNPSNYSSYKSLQNGNENHTLFEAYQNKNIYTFTNTTGATGGVLYYELGMTRPDLVLKDIIKICHPELLENYKPFFFKPLE
ncbi:ABC transporter substrate-binding protein [Hyunsoonleella sp. 2307UL5-6]|uniref:ABC transporter substrate-binding protein n=1 Tax=Hyunsoonleella sp. 2307UL5-6 TaxID=3384768 RepID=UPI0039BD29F1